MRFRGISVLMLVVGALLTGESFGQSISNTEVGGANAALSVILTAGFEGQITLTLTGNQVAPETTFSNIVADTSADVNFGMVSTACTSSPSTGACFRLSDESGARLVATIDAMVVVTGDSTPDFDLGIEADLVVGVNRNLFRVCGGDGSCPTELGDDFWENPANGLDIPVFYLGTELASGAASGTVVEHQLAMEVLDSQPDGMLSLAVDYIASPN